MERNPDSRAQANATMDGKTRSEVKKIMAGYYQYPDFQDAGKERLSEIEHEEKLALQKSQHAQKQWFTVLGWLVAAVFAAGWLKECSASKEHATSPQYPVASPTTVPSSTSAKETTADPPTRGIDSTHIHKPEAEGQPKATPAILDTSTPKN